jgi:hypothetical protein
VSTRWTKTSVKCVEYDEEVYLWSAHATTGNDFGTSHVDLMLGYKKWFLNGTEQDEPLDWPDMKSVDGLRKAMDLAKRLSVRDFEKRQAEGEQ